MLNVAHSFVGWYGDIYARWVSREPSYIPWHALAIPLKVIGGWSYVRIYFYTDGLKILDYYVIDRAWFAVGFRSASSAFRSGQRSRASHYY